MNLSGMFVQVLLGTVRDILPIACIIAFFQLAVLRRPLPRLPRLAWGFAFVVLGLALFLLGLELALFPLGEKMAEQLMALQELPEAVAGAPPITLSWHKYYWTYIFAFTIGMSTTIAEPSLIAVAMKAEEVSGGTIRAWGLRLAVALGVGIGVALGTFRIVVGTPLPWYILPGYAVVVVQTFFAPKQIIPLAYDSGGVTTSTVTVPLVAALGLGLATRVPGRDPMIDGFGLIAFASLFPIMTVMGYAQLAAGLEAWQRWKPRSLATRKSEPQPITAPAHTTPPTAHTPTASTSTAHTPTAHTPTASAPTASAPTASAPTASAPTAHTPTANTPTGNTPTANTPTANTPTANTPTANTPTANTPTANTPTANTPTANTPTASTPTANTPTANTSTESPPADAGRALQEPAKPVQPGDQPMRGEKPGEDPTSNGSPACTSN
jgi:hypothetical protein